MVDAFSRCYTMVDDVSRFHMAFDDLCLQGVILFHELTLLLSLPAFACVVAHFHLISPSDLWWSSKLDSSSWGQPKGPGPLGWPQKNMKHDGAPLRKHGNGLVGWFSWLSVQIILAAHAAKHNLLKWGITFLHVLCRMSCPF